ncbi:MAG: hypothetical protein RDV48_18735 [Candidatus Eremiobacteraeota bacterium]|nr:hypothetical protein [Candidatus Eremiobacteraeota bacterium]
MAAEQNEVKPVDWSSGLNQAAEASSSLSTQRSSSALEPAKSPSQVNASGQGEKASYSSAPEQDRASFSRESDGRDARGEQAGASGMNDQFKNTWSKMVTLNDFIGKIGQSNNNQSMEQFNSLAQNAISAFGGMLDSFKKQLDGMNGVTPPNVNPPNVNPPDVNPPDGSINPGPRPNNNTYEVAGLGENKKNVLNALNAEGATREEQALIMSMGMLETQRMDPSERDGSKDGSGLAKNFSAFNANADLLKRLGVPESRLNSLNSTEGNAEVARTLLKGIREKGADWVLNFQRAGAASLTDPAAYGQDKYRNVIRSMQKDMLADPSLLTDNRRLAYSLEGV